MDLPELVSCSITPPGLRGNNAGRIPFNYELSITNYESGAAVCSGSGLERAFSGFMIDNS